MKNALSDIQREEQRKKLTKKVSEETYTKYVIPGVHKVMEESLFTAVFGRDKPMIETYDYRQDSSVPVLFKMNYNNTNSDAEKSI